MSPNILTNFYRCATEIILTGGIMPGVVIQRTGMQRLQIMGADNSPYLFLSSLYVHQ